MCSKQPCSYSAQGDMVCFSKQPELTQAFALQGSAPFFQGVVYPSSSILNKTDLQTYEKIDGAPAAPAQQAKQTMFEWGTIGRKPKST